MSSYRGIIGPLVLVNPTTNNMTGTTAITSLALDMRTVPRGCIVASWTGSATGTFSCQGSVDNAIFGDMGLGIANSGNGVNTRFIDLEMTGADYVQLVYTNIGGTGTLTVKGTTKS